MNVNIWEVGTIWTLDAQGYLLTPSGVRAARVDGNGVIWLWDKRQHAEVPLTPADVRACIEQRTESHEPNGHNS